MVAIAIVAIGAIVTMVVLTLALLRNGYINKPQLPVPIVPIMLPAEMRVKAFERKAVSLEHEAVALVPDSVAIVCGEGDVPADRYETRNDALRSIARRRDLPKEDVAALMDYLASTNDAMRVERIVAQNAELKRFALALSRPDAFGAGAFRRPQLCAVGASLAAHCGAHGVRALPFVALGSICCLLLPVLFSDSHFLRGFCRAEIGCAA